MMVARFAALMALLTAAAALPGSALFTVRAVTVEGARMVPPDQVRAAAGVHAGGQSLFEVNTAQVAARLTRHPRIAAARVSARPPDTIHIQISERIPAAAVPVGRGYALVDVAGTVVEVRSIPPPLPLISERGRAIAWAALGQPIGSSAVRAGLAILPVVPPAVRRVLAHLQVSPQREVFIYTLEGLEIRAGRIQGLRDRLAPAPEILEAVRAQGITPQYVDLRVADTIIVKPRALP